MTAAVLSRSAGQWRESTALQSRRAVMLIAILCGALGVAALGAAATRWPLAAIGGVAAVCAIGGIAMRPMVGAYLLIVLTPLTGGIDRGRLVPVLRPAEALLALVIAGLVVRALVTAGTPHIRIHFDATARAVTAMAVASSVLPLVWLGIRHQSATSDDVLYALTVWRLLLVYAVFRYLALTDAQVTRCLQLLIGTAVLVAVIGVVQAMGFGPVIHFLKGYYTFNGNTGAITQARGSSTLGLPIAVADLSIYSLAAVVAWIWLRGRSTGMLIGAALALVVGVIGAAEFSGVIGLVVGVVAMCVAMRSVRWLRIVIPGAPVALIGLWPVVQTRLAGFQSTTGLPVSWTGRLTNLRTYFWPQLFSHHNYLLGVRPAARVLAPHRANGFIWIESGYTWLLWAGGIPLLLAYLWFTGVAARASLRAARSGTQPRRVAAVGAFVAVCVTATLMIFDPHLTYRGAADAMFVLLALSASPTTSERGHRDDS